MTSKQRRFYIFCVEIGVFFMCIFFVGALIYPESDNGASPRELFDRYSSEDGLQRIEALAAFAEGREKTYAWLERLLRHGNASEKYEALRMADELGEGRFKTAFLDTAVDPNQNAAVRVAACYALQGSGLKEAEKARLFDSAIKTDTAIVGRASLAALSGCTNDGDAPVLESLLDHDDPLTRLYAARLLTEQGRSPELSFFQSLADSEDYLVRQELYDALGGSDVTGADTLLEQATARETNQSAARAATLALGLYKARHASAAEEARFFSGLFASGGDEARLWALDTLNAIDKERADAAVKKLAGENSDMGAWCRARLRIAGEKVAGEKGLRAECETFSREKHAEPAHSALTGAMLDGYCDQAGVTCFSDSDRLRLTMAQIVEDYGIKPLRHAHNPLTGRGFLGYGVFGGSAYRYMKELLEALDTASEGGDKEAALDLAGRMLHLVEDMSSPLHVFTVAHPFNNCLFEAYWFEHPLDVENLLYGQEIMPVHTSVAPPACLENLDSFSGARLEKRLEAIGDTMPGRLESLAWATYFIASFWGEIRFDDTAAAAHTLPAFFRERHVEAEENILYTMFDGKIRYHTSWWGDYFEIEDRLGNTFSWNKCFLIDGFRPCPNPVGEPSCEGRLRGTAEADGREVMRITGRFYFTQRGFDGPHCYPHRFPSGKAADMHLCRYYGETLFPLTVAHGVGWINLFTEQCPFLFSDTVSGLRTGETDVAEAIRAGNGQENSFGEPKNGESGPDTELSAERQRQHAESGRGFQAPSEFRYADKTDPEKLLNAISGFFTGSCLPRKNELQED